MLPECCPSSLVWKVVAGNEQSSNEMHHGSGRHPNAREIKISLPRCTPPSSFQYLAAKLRMPRSVDLTSLPSAEELVARCSRLYRLQIDQVLPNSPFPRSLSSVYRLAGQQNAEQSFHHLF